MNFVAKKLNFIDRIPVPKTLSLPGKFMFPRYVFIEYQRNLPKKSVTFQEKGSCDQRLRSYHKIINPLIANDVHARHDTVVSCSGCRQNQKNILKLFKRGIC